MIEDAKLLRCYAEEKSEAAFAEVVQRHVNFVYACALRRVGGDAHLAEDVTQQVFTALARDAAVLARHEVLSGWLFTTARNASAQVVRTERRRQAREMEAQIMNELTSAHDAEWERLRPVLDDALDHLSDGDRQAVLLRFFEGKSFADVGAKLRLNENTARMRVERALDKLHALLARRGVTSTTAALGLVLANQAGVAAPAGLATAVTGVALAGGGGAAASAGAWTLFMGISKFQIGIAAAIAVAGATGYIMQAETNAGLRREIAAAQAQQPAVAALRAENQQLAKAVAEVELLRRDDAELKQLEQRVVEIKEASLEATRLAQTQAQSRRKEMEDKLRADDAKAQEEVDRMNREGNKLVGEYKELSTRAAALNGDERAQADAMVKAKMEEIKNKQREIQTFIESVRRLLTARAAVVREMFPGDSFSTYVPLSSSPSAGRLEPRRTPPGNDAQPANSTGIWSLRAAESPDGRGAIYDERGSLEITLAAGQRQLVAKNPKGELLFSGPINTAAERQALPEDVRTRLEESERVASQAGAGAANHPPVVPGTVNVAPRP